MEKEKYIAPEVEIVEFDTEDVITTKLNGLNELSAGSQNGCLLLYKELI